MALAIITETLYYPPPWARGTFSSICHVLSAGLADAATVRGYMGDDLYDVAVREGSIEEIP